MKVSKGILSIMAVVSLVISLVVTLTMSSAAEAKPKKHGKTASVSRGHKKAKKNKIVAQKGAKTKALRNAKKVVKPTPTRTAKTPVKPVRATPQVISANSQDNAMANSLMIPPMLRRMPVNAPQTPAIAPITATATVPAASTATH